MIDRFFRQLHLFFIVELATRRVVHFNVTVHPTDEWVAQQLREATPFDQAPRCLSRDRDSKYGQAFTRVAAGSNIEILKTPYRAPKANAICERFLGSVRRECLDHILILGESHLYRVIHEYVQFFNQARPHQGIEQKTPAGTCLGRKGNQRGTVSRSQCSVVCLTITGAQRNARRAFGVDTDEVIGQDRIASASNPSLEFRSTEKDIGRRRVPRPMSLLRCQILVDDTRRSIQGILRAGAA